MITKSTRGSEWRKWDMHLHSYFTYLNNNFLEISKEDYIQKIVDSDIKVVGLTNYFNFKDEDYELKKDLEKKEIVVFLNLELRLAYQNKEDDCCDFHIIFDNSVPKEQITMLLNNLDVSFNGQTKKACLLSSKTELENSVVELDKLVETLENPSLCLKNKYLLGFLSRGKGNSRTSSVFEKIYEKTDFIIHSSDNERNLILDRDFWLKYNRPLFQSSDAHNVNQIGSKFSWIKADTTFEGLRQIQQEPEGRVYVGDKPPILLNISNNKTKYIDKLTIRPVADYSGNYGKWFNNDISFNKELVAIIGNKGNGKSAIADIIANCCDCHEQQYFSFLNDKKFRDGKIAQNFEATVTFESGTEYSKNLNTSDIAENHSLVKYLPQGYFESICNDLQKEENLKKEIENVVFQYIDEAERLGTASFSELISKKTGTTNEQIEVLKGKISQINREIIELELKENQTYLSSIESAINQKNEELNALEEPEVVREPASNTEESKIIMGELTKFQNSQKELLAKINEERAKQINLAQVLEDIRNFKTRLENLVEFVNSFKKDNKELLSTLGLNIDEIVKFEISKDKLDSLLLQKNQEYDEINKSLSSDNTDESNLTKQLEDINKNIETCEQKLEGPQKAYQAYLKQKEKYENARNVIVGDSDTPQSLTWYENEKKYVIEKLNSDLNQIYENRKNIVRQIYKNKQEVEAIYKKIKIRIDEKIQKNKKLLEEYEINIDSNLSLKNDFIDNILYFIKQNVKGSFKGKQDGEQVLQQIIKEYSIENEDEFISLCDKIIFNLKHDITCNNEQRYIDEQIKDMQSFYNYLFSLDYVDYNYQLKLGDKVLSLLSPGEKGALLLIFYLLLDMDNKPLILDQPEDNLDNNSVAKILVKFIKNAKKQRQIIMVTHNPNLAVVADAEQIIYVNIDKQNQYEFTVESGSIENPEINKHIVDVLEGAMPAFRKRDDKYIKD